MEDLGRGELVKEQQQ